MKTFLLLFILSSVHALSAPLTFTWNPRPTEEAVTAYYLYSVSSSSTNRIASVAGNTTSAQVSLPIGIYRVQITAANSVAEGLPSVPIFIVVNATNVVSVTNAPGAPTNIQIR